MQKIDFGSGDSLGNWYPEVHLVATTAELLGFANDVREAGGGEVIDALLPSYPSNPRSCLIARALNFNCTIECNSGGAWVMVIGDGRSAESIKKMKRIARKLNLKLVETFQENYDDYNHYKGEREIKAIKLPTHIGYAAAAFDSNLAFTEYNNTYGGSS